MNKDEEIRRLSQLTNQQIVNLCNNNSYYQELVDTEKFYQYRTNFLYSNYIKYKNENDSWKDFFTAVDDLLSDINNTNIDSEQIIYNCFYNNNYIALRIIYEEYPEIKNLMKSNDFIASCIKNKDIDILKLLISDSLSVANQILLINTFSLPEIEEFDRYLTYPDLLYKYDLKDLAIFQYLMSTKIPSGVIDINNLLYLVNKATKNGNLSVLEFISESGTLPSPKSFCIALRKGYLEVVNFLYERNPGYIEQIKDLLIYPYSKRISETLMFLQKVCPECFHPSFISQPSSPSSISDLPLSPLSPNSYTNNNSEFEISEVFEVESNEDMANNICMYGTPTDMQWLIDNFNLYPNYAGVINAIQTENFEIIKWIFNLNLKYSDLEYSYVTEALNRNRISSVDMLKYYRSLGFIFNSLAANIAAVNLLFPNVEYLASLGILPNVIGANELIINCNEENYDETVKMCNWLADHAILPNRNVYLEPSLDYKIRQWLERHGVIR